MTPSDPDIQARLLRLQQDYTRRLPDKIGEIEQLWQTVQEQPETDSLQQLARLCHTLAGSGTSYGFAEVTEQCRQLEQLLRPVVEQDRPLDAALSQQIKHHLLHLTALANQAPDSRLMPDTTDDPRD